MKIGILTFHRAYNYGAVLQCYALQEVLKRMGHEVWIIDYVQPKIDRDYYIFDFKKIVRYIYHLQFLSLLGYLKRRPNAYEKRNIFRPFRKKWLHLTAECSVQNIPTEFDVYIVGSDQLWNINLTEKCDIVYWGSFYRKKESRLLTYAVSTNIDVLKKMPDIEIAALLHNFTHVSVREPEIMEYLRMKTGLDIRVDSDPTLITDINMWKPIINDKYKNRRYVLLYEIWARSKYKKKSLYNHAKRLANSLHIELIDLSSYKYKVEDFISAFKYAEVVITSSFHATAFSLIFQRPVYVYRLGDSMDGRYVDLMRYIQADNCLKNLSFYPLTVPQMDYCKINQLLEARRNSSLSYLNSSVS